MSRGDQKLELLKRVRLFAGCTDKELHLLGRACDEVTIPAERVLCEEGSVGYEFFLIVSGTASVRKGGTEVATLTDGQAFGELALLDKGPRTATVVATTPMEVLVLGQREFSGVLDEVPGIAHKLLRSLAGRLREAEASTDH